MKSAILRRVISANFQPGDFNQRHIHGIPCACGYTINVRTEKLAARECPYCGNIVVFDQSKVEDFSCAQCGVRLRTSKTATKYVCPPRFVD